MVQVEAGDRGAGQTQIPAMPLLEGLPDDLRRCIKALEKTLFEVLHKRTGDMGAGRLG